MLPNLLHRTLCRNNRTVLKHPTVNCINEAKHILFYKMYSARLDTPCEYKMRNGDINVDKVRSFLKLRVALLNTGKYGKLNNQKNSNSSIIQKMKPQSARKKETISSYKEIIEEFKIFSIEAEQNNYQITNEIYSEIISTLTAECTKFNNKELLNLLKYLAMWPYIYRNYGQYNRVRRLLKRIDNELIRRAQSESWNNYELFKYCDAVCGICNFYSEFVSMSLIELTVDPQKLIPTDIVRIMYYLFVYNLPEQRVEQFETYIEKYFEEFTMEELQIICLGFFRSEIPITSSTLLSKLIQKIIDNINNINYDQMGAFLKAIRYSFKFQEDYVPMFEELFEALVLRVPDMPHVVLSQLSHLMLYTRTQDDVLITSIIKRFTECIKAVRLKDIDRMILLLVTFNHPPSEPIYDLIIKELRNPSRSREMKKFPKQLGFTLRHLAVANIYPVDLISRIMQQEHMNLAYGSNPNNLGIEYLILDKSIEIEVPHYKGPRLNKNISSSLMNQNIEGEEDTYRRRVERNIVKSINNKLCYEGAASIQRILPHFQSSNIVLCLDEFNNVIPSVPILEKISSSVKYVPTECRMKQKWLAIIFAPDSLLIRDTEKFTGYLNAEIRQLEKVGFIPIVIKYTVWKAMKFDDMKLDYLKKNVLFLNKNLQENTNVRWTS